MASLVNDVNTLSCWKSTVMKKHEVYVCMPPLGTHWKNKLSGVSGVTTAEKRFILLDLFGDKHNIGAIELARNYKFLDGTPITKETLNAHRLYNIIDWMHLESKSTENYWAFYIDIKKYGVSKTANSLVHTIYGDVLANNIGIKHGGGDFLVCADVNGRPDFMNVKLINGNLFSYQYDMRSFPGFIKDDIKIEKMSEPKSILNEDEVSKVYTVDYLKQTYGHILELLAITILQSLYLQVLQEEDDNELVDKLLTTSQMKYGTVSDVTSSSIASCGSGGIFLQSGVKLYIRVCILKNSKLAISLQIYSKSKLIKNYLISNNMSLCLQSLNDIMYNKDIYKRNIDKFMSYLDTSKITSTNIRSLKYHLGSESIDKLVGMAMQTYKKYIFL